MLVVSQKRFTFVKSYKNGYFPHFLGVNTIFDQKTYKILGGGDCEKMRRSLTLIDQAYAFGFSS